MTFERWQLYSFICRGNKQNFKTIKRKGQVEFHQPQILRCDIL